MDIRITHVIELSEPLMALLAANIADDALPRAKNPASSTTPAKPVLAETEDAQQNATDDTAETAVVDDGVIDAAGWPWDASLHASTKSTTKEGLWRMKIGVSRPDPKPGFPKETGATGTMNAGTVSEPSGSAPAPVAGLGEDEDEFAAFRAAADKADAGDKVAAESIPARKWTDADLGALCNQAAVKLGNPLPVKALIAEFCPEGVVAHSRNIPDDQREAFAKATEAKAGIEFAG